MEMRKELSMQIEELRECAAAIIAAADSLEKIFAASTEESAEKTPKIPEQTYTFEEVRHQIATAVDAGYREQMKEMISRYGAKKVSEIETEHYAAFMEEVGQIMGVKDDE